MSHWTKRNLFPSFFFINIAAYYHLTWGRCVWIDWDDVAQNRLALYLDGDVEKLPLRDGLAARIIVNKSSTEITLQNLLSSSINLIFGITKARLHAHSSSFVYPALSGHLIPSEWTHYESRIEGEAFAINNFKFRPGTVSVRIGFLANHGQKGKEVEMVVKNFTFSLIKYSFNWIEYNKSEQHLFQPFKKDV